MVKNIIAAGLGCLYVAISAWIVHSEGEAHRNTLRQARAAAQSATEFPTVAVERKNEENQAEEKPTSSSLPPDLKNERNTVAEPTTPARAPRPPTKPVEKHLAAGPTTSGLAEVKPALPDFAKPAVVNPPVAGNLPAIPPEVIDPFWNQPHVKEKWDLAHLNAENEKRLGLGLNDMVMHFNRRVGTGALQQRVEEAAEPLLSARTRKEIDYKFFVLDSSAVNAFSHPGGYIYVSRGLLDWISGDENYALQFVLAHEIFHVDHQDALKCLEDRGVKNLPIGTLQQFYLLIIPRGYFPDELDFEADAWALRQLKRLHYSRRECLDFMRKLKGYAEANEFGIGRALPQDGRLASLFDNHFRAHPAAFNRLKKLETLMDQAAPKPK
jgi:hypothetical protein